ncbi:MAG: glycine--tRNA ligase subunit beta [Haemophilus haemolyticus]|nr:glycine--tRNA ligase subunit beta [Haemophilus haemolyticus]
MTTQNFLVEIGTEELPPKALKTLATSFADNVEAELNQAGLTFDKIEWFAAPRRLAVKVLNLATQQPSKEIEKRGPAVSAAFDAEGKPTKAAEGWARGCGISVEQAERIATDKGEWLVHRAKIEGQPTKNLLNGIVANALAKLPIPKPMRWADKTVQFIRPVHTVTMLLGDELIEGEILGVASARTIRGHRFLGEKEFEIQHADQYPQLLREKGSVVADFNERKAEILAKSQAKATALGGVADIEESLLEEVTSLVEYPNVLAAKFEERFLAVPAEALVYTMKGDQKYFPIYDKDGKLLPHFIFVSNINPDDPTAIIEGNEKVVRPRLTDAEFFFKTDLKQKLVDRLPRLETVLFQQQLGTLKDKTDRIEQLAGEIAKQIGADEAKAKRAGLLSKCDLMTNMVFEFTDTQGVMGMHYARHDGEDEEVAVALNEQYMPRFAGDELPKSLVASAVALADKFDTLTGIFGIGQAPKGSADPFALRRAALGALRIIVEKNLPLDLEQLINFSIDTYLEKEFKPKQHTQTNGSRYITSTLQSYGGDSELTNFVKKWEEVPGKPAIAIYRSRKELINDLTDFMLGRFRAWYQDKGIAVDVIQAVLARRPTRPADFDARVRAVSHFRTLDSAEALAAANKRVSNILAKADAAIGEINLTACVEPAEKALAEAVLALRTEVQPLIAQGDYTAVLDKLANLRAPVDNFFDNVMVNAEDPALRQNRLAILNTLQGLFLQVADISVLQ